MAEIKWSCRSGKQKKTLLKKQLKNRIILLISITTIYILLYVLLDFFQFPLRKDESHYWQTSLLFSKSLLPNIELIRNYNELNTPLPFILFGFLEYLFHGGIAAGRLVNYIFSYCMVCFIVSQNNTQPFHPVFAAIGMLLFPYYLGCSVLLYTDIIASFFVLAGFLLYYNDKHILSCLSFVLAISSRQYMVAFPVALLLFDIFQKNHKNFRLSIRSYSQIVAILSTFGWILFFGGVGPQNAIMNQNISTVKLGIFFPEYSLYFISCIGLYYVLPEVILFRDKSYFVNLFSMKNFVISIILILLFVKFPPLQNLDYNIPAMGYFDRTLRLFLSDFFRVGLFYLCALIACIRFSSINISFWLLLANSLLMMKAHIAWDKYVLPLLIILWYLKSIEYDHQQN